MDDDIRRKWRALVESDQPWTIEKAVARPSRGEAKGLWVRSASGLAGYLKPTKLNPTRYRAAYEKIAADLAFETSVNVPPAVLYRRTDVPATEETNVVISLCPDGNLFDWKLILSDPSPARKPLLAYALKCASIVVAFDSWLDNDDRNNLDNSIFVPSHEPPNFFLDFSNSMDYRGDWSRLGHQNFQKPRNPLPPTLVKLLNSRIACDSACRIAGISDDTVVTIVRRVPDVFLPAAEKDKLASGLVWRKNHLVDAFDQWYCGA